MQGVLLLIGLIRIISHETLVLRQTTTPSDIREHQLVQDVVHHHVPRTLPLFNLQPQAKTYMLLEPLHHLRQENHAVFNKRIAPRLLPLLFRLQLQILHDASE